MDPTVLVVDDSRQDSELVQAAFAQGGLRVSLRWAASGAQAQAYFDGRGPFADRRQNPLPRLVLLDIKMPDPDGFEVLRWLRAQSADWKRVPVVMLSVLRQSEEISRAYDLGANSYLLKPTGFDELCGLVSETRRYWLERNVA